VGKDTNIGAKRARETRDIAGLADGAPLDCLLTLIEEQLDVPVIVAAFPNEIAGCCWRSGEQTVLWVNGTHPPARQRFTLAHELGHLRCAHDGTVPLETFKTLSGKPTDAREVQANAFAAELLAPAVAVTEYATGGDPGLDEILALAAAFGMSPIAALFRFNSLGLVPRYEELRAAILADEPRVPNPHVDVIATITDLPRLSPALRNSALGGVVTGASSTEAAAHSACRDPGAMAIAAGRIGI
jgi:Zn-dependent peptidase ImmA (M78 family)